MTPDRRLTCRVLPHLVRDGPAQMAIDEALLVAVDADPTSAVFRTYEWAEPTLSLGYFQPLALARADPRFDGPPIVRRPTGGGAIWHDRDLTYALVLPRSHPLAARASGLYLAVHDAIASTLAVAGVQAEPRGPVAEADRERGRPLLCFLDRDPADLLVKGSKVVGSAQRRRPSAVLQHGSILLAGSPATPDLPGLLELAGSAHDARDWSARLAAGLPHRLGLEAIASDLTTDERGRADRLETEVYRASSWTRRR